MWRRRRATPRRLSRRWRNAIKHSDDEVRKVRDRTNGEKAEPSGKAVDDEVRKASEEEGLDSEQIAADAEARREVVLSSASRRDRDEGDLDGGGELLSIAIERFARG